LLPIGTKPTLGHAAKQYPPVPFTKYLILFGQDKQLELEGPLHVWQDTEHVSQELFHVFLY